VNLHITVIEEPVSIDIDTMRAAVLEKRGSPLLLTEVPDPQPGPGDAVLKVLATGVLPYHKDVFEGKRPYPFLTPLIPGWYLHVAFS
jgi:NADPH:quinone reductase-like Zn-dependent oxidoreductase